MKSNSPGGAAASQVGNVALDDPLQGVYKALCIEFTYFLVLCMYHRWYSPFFLMIVQLHATASLKGAIQDDPVVGHSAAANGIMLVLHCHRMLAHCNHIVAAL